MKICKRLNKKVYNKDCELCIFNNKITKTCMFRDFRPGLKILQKKKEN